MRYPTLDNRVPRDPDEPIVEGDRVWGDLLGYWRWAHSDLNSNGERGKLAECLVWLALGCERETSQEWEPYDLLFEGIRVEVKASGYIQSWGQDELSRIVFSIRPARAWDPATNTYFGEVRRQSDVYVFAVETCVDQDTGNPNPLDLSQWDFYVLPTRVLDERVGDRQSLSLSALHSLGAPKADGLADLKPLVREAAASRPYSA